MKLLETLVKRTDEEERMVGALLTVESESLSNVLAGVSKELIDAQVPRDIFHWLPVLDRLKPILEDCSTDEENLLAALNFLRILFDVGYHKMHFLHVEVHGIV
jgi:hypothetical protein